MPRYNLGIGYALEADQDKRIDYTAGVSAAFSRLSVSQQLNYASIDGIDEDNMHSITTVSGGIGRNRLRFTSDYELLPENRLDRVNAELRRNIVRDLEMDLGVSHRMDPRVTEGRAQLNWDAGFANISPAVSYNTDRDMTATLTTRFGLARKPQDGQLKSFERGITNNGGISAFVFLDKNGNNIFDDKDEILPDITLKAPQNGGNEKTDENGYAFFTRLTAMRPTDVFVDSDSLPDPFWVSGFEGVSVIPREGNVTALNFPIHLAGEIDGMVYLRAPDGTVSPLRGVSLALIDQKGKKTKTLYSESDGFFLFEKVPPGQYYLTVEDKSHGTRMARPLPTPVTIGFDGTTLYGKNLYFDAGKADVPVRLASDLSGENIAPEKLQGRSVLVSIGNYKSSLMMGLMWFKAKTLLGSTLAGLDLLEKPSESLPDSKGEYSLRFTAANGDLDNLYKKCRTLGEHGYSCRIDLLAPAVAEKKVASKL